MSSLIRSVLTAFLLFSSVVSQVSAGYLQFAEDEEWAVFQGPFTATGVDEAINLLQSKKPKLIILNSSGGNIAASLRLAQFIRESGINTWVRENAICASACVLVFLSGEQRLCEGEMYLHQFLPAEAHKDHLITLDKAFIHVQRQIGEIVMMLNSFDAPDFILERILNHQELYRLTDADLAKINTLSSFEGITE